MTPSELFTLMVQQGDLVTDRFHDCLRRHPDKTFIYYGEADRAVSYQAFYDEVSRLAAALQGLDIAAEDRVSVFTRNAYLATLAMFAIWEIGAVYAPVNFNYMGRLLAYQLKDTAPKALIFDTNMAATVGDIADELSIPHLIVHEPRPGDHDHQGAVLPATLASRPGLLRLDEILARPGQHRRVPRTYADIANIVYTSGTTGPAKGVVQPYRWINQYTFYGRNLLDADDTIYCDLPMYHVGGALFLVAKACWTGATVALYDRFSPQKFWERIRRTQATNCVLLDVMVPWLMSAPPSPADREHTLKSVHMQPLPLTHRAVAERFGFEVVSAGFGQTESGNGFIALIDEFNGGAGRPAAFQRGLPVAEVFATARRLGVMVVQGSDELAKGFMGRASPLLETAVLDAADNVCAPGEIGQLGFRPRFPELLLRNYFNKPETTVKVFSNLWFHTGDACYRTADEVYYFVDRMGGFFRVRGENVSSYQVEDLLNGHPKIRATAAVPIPATDGDEEDCAVFIELMENEQMSEAELRDFARQVMPKFMSPKYVRFVAALPLTPTSKVEKYKLKQGLLAELAGPTAGA